MAEPVPDDVHLAAAVAYYRAMGYTDDQSIEGMAEDYAASGAFRAAVDVAYRAGRESTRPAAEGQGAHG